LGVGTASPTATGNYRVTEIKSANATNGGMLILTTSDGAGVARLYNTSTQVILDDSGSTSDIFIKTNSSNPLLFGVNNTEQMRLTSTGLGIGTSSPGFKLEVNSGSTDATALFNSTNVNGAHLRLASSGTVKNFIGCAAGFITSGSADDLGLRAVGNISFATNGAAADMTLDSSGNLGLGVTPDAWDSTLKAFDIGNFGSYLAAGTITFSASGQLFLGNNGYSTGGANFIYRQSAASAQYRQLAGSHIWFTAPSGTAGNAISFTQAMTLDASGRLGIGTTSPTNALSVTGNANITGNVTLGDASTDTVTVNGYMGVGGALSPTVGLNITSSALTSTNQWGAFSGPTGTSSATTLVAAYGADPKTAAAVFTCTDVIGYQARDADKGAGSTITNLHGVYVDDQTQGTNNFGITSLVSSGTNKWNIYASGTAANYFAGNVQFAAGSAAAPALTRFGDDNTGIFFPAADTIAFAEGGAEAMRIDSSGNLLVGTTASFASEKLSVFGSTFNDLAAGNGSGNTSYDWLVGASGNVGFPVKIVVDQGASSTTHGMSFYTSNAASPTERMRITSAGNVSIGGTADRATTVGTKALNIFDGTAPVGTLANGVSFYSASGEANVMDAAGNATLLSPHDSETNEWIFRSKHTPTGKVLRIDVERLLRFVNEHFGLDAVKEFVER
jgi:hypothetical protein